MSKLPALKGGQHDTTVFLFLILFLVEPIPQLEVVRSRPKLRHESARFAPSQPTQQR